MSDLARTVRSALECHVHIPALSKNALGPLRVEDETGRLWRVKDAVDRSVGDEMVIVLILDAPI